MLYFKLNAEGKVIDVANHSNQSDREQWLTRHQIVDILHANRIASQASEATGRLHTAVDAGPCVWPRFDVEEAPRVGEKVSYGFNGDYYPDGEIVSVTPGTLRVVKTSTGNTYYRRKQTGMWLRKGGTWAMVNGHVDVRNPSF